MSKYSNKTKAEAFGAMASGEPMASISERLEIPVGTLKSWKHRGPLEIASIAKQVNLSSPHQIDHLGDHLVGYMCELLIALKAQAVFASDEEWLKMQSADQLAALHGVFADRAILLLEALAEPPTYGAGAG